MFDGIGLTRPLWPHQVRALAALDRDMARGDRATYLVVPPGGGKTLIGLEAARRLGRRAVVLCPNTAIQAQWMAQWQASFGPDVVPPPPAGSCGHHPDVGGAGARPRAPARRGLAGQGGG